MKRFVLLVVEMTVVICGCAGTPTKPPAYPDGLAALVEQAPAQVEVGATHTTLVATDEVVWRAAIIVLAQNEVIVGTSYPTHAIAFLDATLLPIDGHVKHAMLPFRISVTSRDPLHTDVSILARWDLIEPDEYAKKENAAKLDQLRLGMTHKAEVLIEQIKTQAVEPNWTWSREKASVE